MADEEKHSSNRFEALRDDAEDRMDTDAQPPGLANTSDPGPQYDWNWASRAIQAQQAQTRGTGGRQAPTSSGAGRTHTTGGRTGGRTGSPATSRSPLRASPPPNITTLEYRNYGLTLGHRPSGYLAAGVPDLALQTQKLTAAELVTIDDLAARTSCLDGVTSSRWVVVRGIKQVALRQPTFDIELGDVLFRLGLRVRPEDVTKAREQGWFNCGQGRVDLFVELPATYRFGPLADKEAGILPIQQTAYGKIEPRCRYFVQGIPFHGGLSIENTTAGELVALRGVPRQPSGSTIQQILAATYLLLARAGVDMTKVALYLADDKVYEGARAKGYELLVRALWLDPDTYEAGKRMAWTALHLPTEEVRGAGHPLAHSTCTSLGWSLGCYQSMAAATAHRSALPEPTETEASIIRGLPIDVSTDTVLRLLAIDRSNRTAIPAIQILTLHRDTRRSTAIITWKGSPQQLVTKTLKAIFTDTIPPQRETYRALQKPYRSDTASTAGSAPASRTTSPATSRHGTPPRGRSPGPARRRSPGLVRPPATSTMDTTTPSVPEVSSSPPRSVLKGGAAYSPSPGRTSPDHIRISPRPSTRTYSPAAPPNEVRPARHSAPRHRPDPTPGAVERQERLDTASLQRDNDSLRSQVQAQQTRIQAQDALLQEQQARLQDQDMRLKAQEARMQEFYARFGTATAPTQLTPSQEAAPTVPPHTDDTEVTTPSEAIRKRAETDTPHAAPDAPPKSPRNEDPGTSNPGWDS